MLSPLVHDGAFKAGHRFAPIFGPRWIAIDEPFVDRVFHLGAPGAFA